MRFYFYLYKFILIFCIQFGVKEIENLDKNI